MSRRWLTVSERCPRCNFAIERKEGHFVGAVGMNTIVTFGAVGITLLIALVATAGEPLPAARWSVIAMIVAVVVGTGFYPISRTLWSAIDLILVPLEPGEVDPRYDPSVTLDDKTPPNR